MAQKISVRKQFLAKRKNEGKRVTVGFTGIADLRHFIALEYIKGMMKACADYDINFLNMGAAIRYSFFDDINFLSHYLKNFKFMRPPLVDGMVTWAASLYEFMDEESIIRTFSELCPLPMVDIGHLDIPGASMIKIDSSSSIKSIIDHLVEIHHYKRFAFIGTDVSDAQVRRLLNFRLELKRHGLSEIPGAVIMMNKKMQANFIDEALETLIDSFDLHEKKEIDAILTGSDVIAAELVEHLYRLGYSVPKDVAVLGFNNWYESIRSRSPITTIDLVCFKRGYAAVEMLIDKIIEPESKPEIQYFKTDLIIRQSCGCLENSVSFLQEHKKIAFSGDFPSESESELRLRLISEIQKSLPNAQSFQIDSFLDAFFRDIYETDLDDTSFLQDGQENKQLYSVFFFRNILQDYRKNKEFDCDYFQNAVTVLRAALIPVIKNEGAEKIFFAEGIFHQLRVLISVFQKYDLIADRENPYRLNAITSQSLSFTNAQKLSEVFDSLKQQMSMLDIQSCVVALSDEMSYSFPSPEIKFIWPETNPEIQGLVGKKISEPNLFPVNIFSSQRRFSAMLEVIHNSEQYFGYAFFEIKSLNIAIYDAIRMMLSNALYVLYKKEGRIKNSSFGVTRSQVQDLIQKGASGGNISSGRQRLTAEKITNYLTEHLGEMTDVEKMARSLMVSRSFLSKKCKELTGLSVQTLHEKLKIEQAKNMLLLQNIGLSEIALTLGFKNQNYFSNVFKKNTGLSPLNWVKKN
ncbi:MAG: substrate-binding domain-containing protein [Treponema sp.]|nr:substrate-binding domain-containing protein [Treponema sp.]